MQHCDGFDRSDLARNLISKTFTFIMMKLAVVL